MSLVLRFSKISLSYDKNKLIQFQVFPGNIRVYSILSHSNRRATGSSITRKLKFNSLKKQQSLRNESDKTEEEKKKDEEELVFDQ